MTSEELSFYEQLSVNGSICIKLSALKALIVRGINKGYELLEEAIIEACKADDQQFSVAYGDIIAKNVSKYVTKKNGFPVI